MWVISLDGFLSVVQKNRDKGTDNVEVRSRNSHDLRRFIKRMNIRRKIIETPQADYPFRIVTTRKIWGKYLAQMAEMISYDNFKHQIGLQDGKDRAKVYLRVWSDLLELEKITE